MAGFFARIESFLVRLLVTLVCLAVIAGAAIYYYAYYRQGPSSEKARVEIERARSAAAATAKEESQRWAERLEELKAQLKDTAERVSKGDETTTRARERIEALKQRIARYEEEFGPTYREKLKNWRQTTDEALEALKGRSAQAGAMLRSLANDVRNQTAQGQSPKSPPPPGQSEWPKSVHGTPKP